MNQKPKMTQVKDRRIGKRRHACSQCQGQALDQLAWKNHLQKYQAKWRQNYQRQWWKDYQKPFKKKQE